MSGEKEHSIGDREIKTFHYEAYQLEFVHLISQLAKQHLKEIVVKNGFVCLKTKGWNNYLLWGFDFEWVDRKRAPYLYGRPNGRVVYRKKEWRFHCLEPLLMLLRQHTQFQFKQLTDLYAVDLPNNRKRRFRLVHILLSFRFNLRIIVDSGSYFEENLSPSASHVFMGAGWLEREIWDMFGIFFSKILDPRRILTDYGFEGFPLRKDFPITGFSEIWYDEQLQKIDSIPIILMQSYRYYDFQNPWIRSKILY